MRSGSLRHRITIETPNDARQATGEVVPDFVTFAANIPASIEPLSSREFFAAAQVQSEVGCRIRIRWMRGITERMRIRHELTEFSPPEVEYFSIEGQPLTDDTGRREILMYVVRRSTQGFRE
jgi:SPP1 family predicted phage head-tail adaptor